MSRSLFWKEALFNKSDSIWMRFSLASVVSPHRIRSMLSFLDEVDQYPCLYFNHQILTNAIRRYEQLWIPLLLSIPAIQRLKLAPPVDIEWVWHCHLLCPHVYVNDIARISASVSSSVMNDFVDHSIISAINKPIARQRAAKLWSEKYPSEPFNVTDMLREAPTVSSPTPGSSASQQSVQPSLIAYDIRAAASRQMAFHYQVAILPHFRTTQFLEGAIKRYEKFLRLRQHMPDQVIVPTYDIDAVWHTHMSHPTHYALVCNEMFGSIFKHDDTLNDRSAGSRLLNQWEITRSNWKAVDNLPIERPGAMWRGQVSMEERCLRSLLQGAVRAAVAKMSGLVYSIVQDPTNLLAFTRTETYNSIPWIHAMGLRQALERHGEELRTFTECEDPVVRRLSVLKDYDGKELLTACVTLFPDARSRRFSSVPAQTMVEIFVPWLNIPIASAHIALPGSVVFPDKIAHASTKALMVLRVGGVDVGLLCGAWLGFRAPSKEVVDNLMNRENIRLSRPVYNSLVNGSPGMLWLQMMNTTSGGNGVWQHAQWSSAGRAVPKKYRFTTLPRPDAWSGNDISGSHKKFGMGSISFDLSRGQITVEDEKDALMGFLVSLSAASLWVLLQPRYKPATWRGVESNSTYPRWATTQRDYVALKAAGGERTGKGIMEGLGPLLLKRFGEDCGLQGSVDEIMRFKVNPSTEEAGCGGCGGCVYCGGLGECPNCEPMADLQSCYLTGTGIIF